MDPNYQGTTPNLDGTDWETERRELQARLEKLQEDYDALSQTYREYRMYSSATLVNIKSQLQNLAQSVLLFTAGGEKHD